MKCTPAHDPNDFAIAERHHLPRIICMNPDATMNERCGEFEGMDRFECRKQLTEKNPSGRQFDQHRKHIHQVGYSGTDRRHRRTDAFQAVVCPHEAAGGRTF